MPRIVLFFILTSSLFAAGPAPRNDAWEIVGPGGGGAMFIPTVSPLDPSRVLVGCDMTGSYISLDGGESWRTFNLRGRSSFFVFDPVNPDVIYARGVGLWRSADAGRTWALVYPDPATVTGISNADDHSSETIWANGRPAPRVLALAVDPAESRTLYAAIQDGRDTNLFASTDWGATWARITPLADGAQRIYIDPQSPAEDRTLYVIGSSSIFKRENGAWRLGTAPAGLTGITDVSAGFAEDGTFVVYAILQSAMYVTEDAGGTWRQAAISAASFKTQAIAASLNHGDVAYVSYSGLRLEDGTWFGVAKTTDRGQTWEIVWREANRAASNVFDAWLTPRFGPGWAGNPLALGVAPSNPDIAYGGDYGRTMRTTDGGKTWKAVYSAQVAGAGYTTTGLDVTTNYGIHFDPFDPNRQFITYTDIGLFRSEDGGKSWFSSIDGVPRGWWNTTYWVVFDPEVRGRMWGVMSKVHDLPRPKMWRSTSVSTYDGGVCASDDGGKTWRNSSDGMAPTAATHILLDPGSPADARVLYVAGFGRGVYKSPDGGKTWQLKNNGLEGSDPFAWRLAMGGDGALYVILARRTENGSFGDAGDGALYRSTDGAESWTRLALPRGVNGPNGLLVDPQDPKRLYLAVWGRSSQGVTALDGGIFLSTDAGETWRNIFSGDQHVYDVAIDSRGVLYASGFENSAWRSEDRGDTWTRIRGYNFKWGHRVVPDPQDADKIYVTTFGGSVWHGPAAGDPNAVEDIVSPGVSVAARVKTGPSRKRAGSSSLTGR